jgi:hypothetical protein
MEPLVVDTIEALRGAGWDAELAKTPQPLPPHILERHRNIPPLAAKFFTNVERCVRGDEGCWLLTAADYAGPPPPDGFGWDAFERILTDPGLPPEGVRQAPPDPKAFLSARRFWGAHLPIFQFVAGDYEYMALVTDPAAPHFGKIVHGDLVDFDSATPMADSFKELLTRLLDIARRPPTRSLVYDDYLTMFVHADIVEDGSVRPWEKGLGARLGRWFGLRR